MAVHAACFEHSSVNSFAVDQIGLKILEDLIRRAIEGYSGRRSLAVLRPRWSAITNLPKWSL